MSRRREDWEIEASLDWHYRAQLTGRPGTGRSLSGGLMLSAILVVIGLAVLAWGDKADIRLAFAAYINLIVAIGLQIFMGNANIANLSHSGFMGLGAYMTAVFATPIAIKETAIPNAPFGLAEVSLDVVPAVLAALSVTAVVAFLIGLVVARMAGIAATILTLSVLVIIHSTLVQWTDLFRGNQAFFGIPQEATFQWAVVAVVVVVMLARLFRDSPAGVQLRATAANRLAAEAMGVNVFRLRLLAWTLGATVASLGGVLFAYYVGTINARSFYFSHVFLTLAMLILGGMRTVSGAVVGVAVVTIGIELIRKLETGPVIFGIDLPGLLGLSGIALGVIIVLFMAMRPEGIMGYEELDETLRRWWAGRGTWRQRWPAFRKSRHRPIAEVASSRRSIAERPERAMPSKPAGEPAPGVVSASPAATESMFDPLPPARRLG